MPLYQQECSDEACGHLFEEHRPVARYDQLPPCPQCGKPSVRAYLPQTVKGLVAPVIVYKGPDGNIRFPGHKDHHQYEKKGYERIEIRGAHEMRRFEQTMNRHEFSRASRKTEYAQQAREAQQKVLRSALRDRFTSMTRAGRDLAREAMRRNDNKPVERTREAGFHSEIYSYDRGNREEGRDNHGRRMRD